MVVGGSLCWPFSFVRCGAAATTQRRGGDDSEARIGGDAAAVAIDRR